MLLMKIYGIFVAQESVAEHMKRNLRSLKQENIFFLFFFVIIKNDGK